MHQSIICQGCWEKMHFPVAIRGPFSYVFKAFGIRKSRMNPNLCTLCESMFEKLMKKKQISTATTILFADIRGYTDMAQNTDSAKMNELLHCFYDHCSEAVWKRDGIINKFIGDAVLAIFNFPLSRDEHVMNAVNAAVDLQKSCRNLRDEMGLHTHQALDIGIGIQTGECFIGEVGRSYKDFTAIGPMVNFASRLQGAAKAGEILVSEEVYAYAKGRFPNAQKKTLQLKGIDRAVDGYVLA